jgi:hypothetical protein
MPTTIDDPKHWHDYAEEMRSTADLMKTEDARLKMLKVAEDYDKLGVRAAERLQKPRPENPSPGG